MEARAERYSQFTRPHLGSSVRVRGGLRRGQVGRVAECYSSGIDGELNRMLGVVFSDEQLDWFAEHELESVPD